MGGAFVVMLLLVFFFMPESAYHRHNVINIDTSSKTVETDAMEKEKSIEYRRPRDPSIRIFGACRPLRQDSYAMVWLLGSCLLLAHILASFCCDREPCSHVGHLALHDLHILARLDLYHVVADLLRSAVQFLR
jgi:hypothetical protein